MVTILIMSAEMATLGLPKVKVFEIKFVTSLSLSMTPQTKFYYVAQIIL